MAGAPGNIIQRITRTAPDKGSFPIDHDNECKKSMLNYLKCLREHNFDNAKCRPMSKEYLRCRMENGLMAKEEWKVLGFEEDVNQPTSTITTDDKPS